MSTKNKIFEFTEHLSDEQLSAYVHDELSSSEKHKAEKHCIDCEMCNDALEGLLALREKGRLPNVINTINKNVAEKIKPTTKVVFMDMRVRFAIAACVVLLVGAVFFFNNQLKENAVTVSDNFKQPNLEEEKKPLSEGIKNDAPDEKADLNKKTDKKSGESRLEDVRQNNAPLTSTVTTNEMAPEQPGSGGKDNGDTKKQEQQKLTDPNGDGFTKQNSNLDDVEVDMTKKEEDNVNRNLNEKTVTQKEKEPYKDADKNKDFKGKKKSALSDEEQKKPSPQKSPSSISQGAPPPPPSPKETSNDESVNYQKYDTISGGYYGYNTTNTTTTSGNNQVLSNTSNTLMGAAFVKFNKSKYADAADLFKKVLEKEPANFEAMFYLEQCLYQTKKYSEAQVYANKIIEDGKSVYVEGAKYYLALALIETKYVSDAKKYLNEVIQMNGTYKTKAESELKKMK